MKHVVIRGKMRTEWLSRKLMGKLMEKLGKTDGSHTMNKLRRHVR